MPPTEIEEPARNTESSNARPPLPPPPPPHPLTSVEQSLLRSMLRPWPGTDRTAEDAEPSRAELHELPEPRARWPLVHTSGSADRSALTEEETLDRLLSSQDSQFRSAQAPHLADGRGRELRGDRDDQLRVGADGSAFGSRDGLSIQDQLIAGLIASAHGPRGESWIGVV